jgi:hypothetical protein
VLQGTATRAGGHDLRRVLRPEGEGRLGERRVEEQVAQRVAGAWAVPAREQPAEDGQVRHLRVQASQGSERREDPVGELPQRVATPRTDEDVRDLAEATALARAGARAGTGPIAGRRPRRRRRLPQGRVDVPQRRQVLDHAVDQHRLHHVDELIVHLRLEVVGGECGVLDRLGRVRGDDHEAVRAERERGLERRVETDAAIGVPPAAAARVGQRDRGERRRDRRRRDEVVDGELGRHVVGRSLGIRRRERHPVGALDEDHRPSPVDVRRRDREGLDRALGDLHPGRLERPRPPRGRARQRTGVQQAPQPTPTDQTASAVVPEHPWRVAEQRTPHLVGAQLLPEDPERIRGGTDPQLRWHVRWRPTRERGQQHGVERARTRADEGVRSRPGPLHLRDEPAEGAGLVRTASPRAGDDHRDPFGHLPPPSGSRCLRGRVSDLVTHRP